MQAFYDAIGVFPFRNNLSMIISTYQQTSEIVHLQCISIVNGKEINNCMEPIDPVNPVDPVDPVDPIDPINPKKQSNTWWIILISCLLGAVVIAIIIWVIYYIKKHKGYKSVDNNTLGLAPDYCEI
ncbi:Hypothetical_protein [Hexamita inflata]|uniref:Hypothetical_protein n=1 Tax=Hexamita inflata TaxID=28002 RepID=A0AA86RJ28_9EUKA|nr:Hypothetical protein HINF_LOCUS66651 [Hexamita inflata]